MMSAPVDLYLRLSDARREEALDGREKKLRAEADRLGWTVRRVVIENDRLPDGSMKPASAWKQRKIITPSGRVELRTVRPGFRSVLDAIMTGVNLLAEDLDRMLRQPRDGEDLIDAIQLSGMSARSLTGSLTLTHGGSSHEQMTARIMAAVANKASSDTARRVADARERLAGQSYQGGRRPFGYRVEKGTEKYHRTLVIDQAEAKVITDAATAILEQDVSLKAVARDLRETGFPTVTGAQWSAGTLRDILLKPAIAGIAVHTKVVRDDETGESSKVTTEHAAPWDAILERDIWERLRDKLTAPERRTNAARANEPRWLVSGTARCGICDDGTSLHATGGHARGPAYVCDAHSHMRRNAVHVDGYISGLVVERLSSPDAADLLRPPPRAGTDVSALRAEARKLMDRKSALARIFVLDGDEAALASGNKVIRDRLTVIESQLAASDTPDPLAEFRDNPAGVVWEKLSMARKRAIVRVLFEDITILPVTRRGRGFDPGTLSITWRKA
jgi:site-specific DNA recombinase